MLANLGSPGFPSVVYYRIPTKVVMFSKLKEDQEIQVITQLRIPLDDLHSFIETNDQKFHGTTKTKGKSCLILELAETENDPTVSIPTLVTVSTRMAEETLKSFFKGSLLPMLVDPPTNEQILFIEWTRYLKGVDLWYLNNQRLVDEPPKKQQLLPPNNQNKTIFETIVDKMLYEVGPIPRAFSTRNNYNNRVSNLQTGSLPAVINSINELTPFNIPSLVEFFLAPYPKKKSEDDPNQPISYENAPVCERGLIIWKFLSPTAEKIFADAKLSQEQYKRLEDVGVNYIVAESRVKRYLNKEFPDNWEWCRDVGYEYITISKSN